MIFNNKHIKILGRIVVSLFFLASSGFTVILNTCVMDTPECCDTTCRESLPSPMGPSVQGQLGCHANTVAGGLNSIPALVEKGSKPQNNRLEILSETALHCAKRAQSGTSSWFTVSFSHNISPPSVEKYVLNASFLI